MIDLHYWPTPNGKKVTILLEEAEVPYKVVPCSIGEGQQFAPDFLAISPNNRMPALVDHEPDGGGGPLSVFESGAMMMYIAEKVGKFYPQDLRTRYDVNQGHTFGRFRIARFEDVDLAVLVRHVDTPVYCMRLIRRHRGIAPR